ncbi:MAG: hypothetical protein ABI467_21730 [Kofleriaceae bacterium]
MRWVVLALLVGCTPSPEQAVDDVCSAFCDCTASTPSLIDHCLAQCVPELPAVTPTCTACVDSYEATCTGLIDTCYTECFSVATPDTKGSR